MVGNLVGPRSGRLIVLASVSRRAVGALLGMLALGTVGASAHAQGAPGSRVAANAVETPAVPLVTIDLDHMLLKTALELIAQKARLSPVYGDAVSSSNSRVSVHVRQAPVTTAFEQALQGTGLTVVILPSGYVKIVDRGTETQATGAIRGTVTDARTKRPVEGATVVVDSATRGVVTKADGTFSFPSVSVGTHLITARMLRYGKQTRRVQVQADQIRRIDFALDERANALDQVVVTGTVVPVEQRAISNAVTVITAKQLEDRNITHIDQLFRGDVPGVFVPNYGTSPKSIVGGVGPTKFGAVTMYSRGSTVLPNTGVGGTDAPVFNKVIKTYVDGILIADPDYINQIDPKSIDRIEIITGPQASTLYGSDALGGVMQIFTKHGNNVSRPQLTASLQYGMIQNNFSPGLAPQHNDNVQLTDIVGPISYNVGGTYSYTGQWTPGSWTRSVSGYGGARREAGPLTVDLTARFSHQNMGNGGASLQQALAESIINGTVPYTVSALLTQPASSYDITGETFGTTIGYSPFRWWRNQLTLGTDQSSYGSTANGAVYTSPSDSLNVMRLNNYTDAVSGSFNTTADNYLGGGFHSTLTLGADLRHTHYRSISEQSNDVSVFQQAYDQRTRDRTRGVFGQWLLGYHEAIFLTLGLRGEQSPNYGSGHDIDYAPRYGLSVVHEFGAFTAKARYTEGRSTRPPDKGEKDQILWCTANPGFYCDYYTGLYGANLVTQRAANVLQPASQRGPEYGIDLYFGNRGSLSLTAYNQKVFNLISSVTVDSVYATDSASYPYPFYVTQYQNVGDVKNSGLTAEGSISQGPFTLNGTWSYTKSRIMRLAPGYVGADGAGDAFQGLAEHTGAVTLTYTNAAGLISATLNTTGQILAPKSVNGQDLQFGSRAGQAYVPRMFDSQPLTAMPPSAQLSLNATRMINRNVTLFLNVLNATNYYRNEGNQGNVGTFPVMGRQTSLGARLRF